jgi:hypothetical protein
MIGALEIILGILSAFAALGLMCAVWIGLRRPAQADPFSIPFGEMPGFTAEQLRRIAPPRHYDDPQRRSFATRPMPPIVDEESAGLALRPDADGGRPVFPSWLASIGNFVATPLRRWQRGGRDVSA